MARLLLAHTQADFILGTRALHRELAKLLEDAVELWANQTRLAGLSPLSLPPPTAYISSETQNILEGPRGLSVSVIDWTSETLCSRCFPTTFLWRNQGKIAALVSFLHP